LVSIVREHLETFGVGPDGRVFHSSSEGPLQETANCIDDQQAAANERIARALGDGQV